MPVSTSQCRWCGAAVDTTFQSCPGCGGQVGRSTKPTNSGWTELPPIKDMARIRIGASTCQIEGLFVPVADFNLAEGDAVYLAHHVLLWKDPQVQIERMPMAGAFNRLLAGMPIVMTRANGPGHIAFSRDEAGEMIALPLHVGRSVDVCEHMFLAATKQVAYTWTNSGLWYITGSGDEQEYHYPLGQFMDRFKAVTEPGLLLLHAAGNVFVRDLAQGETLQIKPEALVYKDPSVHMALSFQYPTNSPMFAHRLMWLHLIGPGRVAIQSAYEPVEDNGRTINSVSSAPWRHRVQHVQPVARPVDDNPIHTTEAHLLITKMVSDAMSSGEIPAAALDHIIHVAQQHGLSAYDVRLVVNHVKSRRQ